MREFEETQPHEFYSLIEGYEWRKKERQMETAYWMSHLINISGKMVRRSVKPEDLLKPLQPKKKKKRDINADLAYLRKKFPGEI